MRPNIEDLDDDEQSLIIDYMVGQHWIGPLANWDVILSVYNKMDEKVIDDIRSGVIRL